MHTDKWTGNKKNINIMWFVKYQFILIRKFLKEITWQILSKLNQYLFAFYFCLFVVVFLLSRINVSNKKCTFSDYTDFILRQFVAPLERLRLIVLSRCTNLSASFTYSLYTFSIQGWEKTHDYRLFKTVRSRYAINKLSSDFWRI